MVPQRPEPEASAKAFFAALVERHERGEPVAWEEEFAARPAQRAELREFLARWRRVEALFAGLVTDAEMLDSAARAARSTGETADEGTRVALERLAEPRRGAERYRELERIAQGGMGTVTRVFDRDLQRELALKTLRTAPRGSSSPDGRALRRFLQEARIAARLEHPGILPVHDVGVDADGRPYFTMPLVRGRSLAQVLELARTGAEGWSLARVLEVVLKVCDALAYAHEQGVVHRDLKPANVLVGRFGETYVTDWGLARSLREGGREREPATDDAVEAELAPATGDADRTPADAAPRAAGPATASGAVLGTVHYMAPEQARGELERIGPRSDVYAIGAILYHALAGRRPFHGADEDAALAALRRGPPRSLALLAPAAPRELVSICERAMGREPVDRYRSCAEMADDLRAYLEGRVVAAHEQGPWAEARKWVARHRIVVALAVTAATIAALSLVVNRWIERERQSENALLAEGQALDELLERAPALWPAGPAARAAFERWIAEAEALAARLPEHERELARLRAGAAAGSGARRHRFEDPAEQWRHDTLARLVKGLQVLASDDPAVSALADVRAGLAFARDVERRTLVDARADWSAAAEAIAASSAYAGLRLAPQLGLVPLGPSPDSGLWEFADLATGEPPRRAPDGRLELRPESGVVLVLVPGGRLWMGSTRPAEPGGDPRAVGAAREVDLLARPDETPVVEVEVEPFFLARHELTQAQWRRITHAAPSRHVAGDPDGVLPVETVSWHEARAALARVALALPTEAQWEYAARAGGSTRFWCGREAACLAGNVQAGWLADGRPLHAGSELATAPVDAGSANAWGFQHVAGNVAEWVEDAYAPTLAGPRRPGDGLAGPLGAERRVVRGGSYLSTPADLRSAARRASAPETRSPEVGLRPARRLQR